MKILRTTADIRPATARWRGMGARVALVPMMGYLHAGHLALVARARARALADRVVVSIVVNPTRFGPTEDVATYPRDEARDLALLQAAGAETVVETTRLSRTLIGRQRPGQFRGAATVVTKLFNIVQPDIACFGQKD
jgi:pantoate--beta-alanine ligase